MSAFRRQLPRLAALATAVAASALFLSVKEQQEVPADEPEAVDLDAGPLRDPETELGEAKGRIDNLVSRLDAAKSTYERPGLGPQTFFAERSYENAVKYFAAKEWLSTVRELNNYLNQTQVPSAKPYAQAQYMLARSYEELALNSKSIRAYMRYLAAFLTAKEQDHAQLLDVLRRMIPLAAADESTSNELNQLIASLTNLEWPEHLRASVFYLSAKAVANRNQPRLAGQFLQTTLDSTEDPSLRARARYMQALIALAARDFDKAEETLSEALQQAGDVDQPTRDLARLALARISIHRKKPETALKYYALLGPEAPGYRSALFESVYVHLRLGQDAAARAKALDYLATFGSKGPAAETFQLRTLLAYLDLRAADTDSALKTIAAADGQLADVGNYLRQQLAGRTAVTQSQLSDFVTLSSGAVESIPSVREGQQLFSRLAEVRRRLADARGEVRGILYGIGRADLAALRPRWVNRAESLARMGDELLTIGHRMIAAERHLYRERLDEVDWQTLTASERRRTLLLSPLAAMRRKMPAWGAQLTFLDLTQDVAAKFQQLKTAEAELAAGRYLIANSKAKKPSKNLAVAKDVNDLDVDFDFNDDKTTTSPNFGEVDERANRLAELEQRSAKLSEQLQRALELVRARKVESLLAQSPHRAERKLLTQFANALSEEATLISSARGKSSNNLETLLAADAAFAWRRWEYAAKELFGQLEALDTEIGSGLRTILADLDGEEQQHAKLDARLRELTSQLENRMGTSIGYIVDQYAGAIDARLSRNKKWRADIEWLTYQGKLQEASRRDDRNRLEQQILKDQLTDLKQGVIWQWPN